MKINLDEKKMNYKKFKIFEQFPEITAVETQRNKELFENQSEISPNYLGLNLAFHVNDDFKQVENNREILAKDLNFDLLNLKYMEQIHTDNIKIVNKNSPSLINECDAILTTERNLPLMVMVADCIPILIYDKNKQVIGAIHSGRNGTFLKIVSKTIQKMKKLYNSNPKDIFISFGSSIGFECYEVSEEIGNIFVQNFGKQFVKFKNNKALIDLPSINRELVLLEGIPAENIEISDTCNHCNVENYFSYRVPNLIYRKIKDQNTGRFANIIILNQN